MKRVSSFYHSHFFFSEIYGKDWQYFSYTDAGDDLDISVSMDAEERYFVLLPCRMSSKNDGIWFKISFRDENGDKNSHVELINNSRGNIFCRNASDSGVTDFSMDITGIKCNNLSARMIE